MFTRSEEEKKLLADFLKRLDRAFLKMQYEEDKRVLEEAAKNPVILRPDQIDEKVRFCMKFQGRGSGKRLFYTQLLMLAEIQRNREGGKLWPFIVIPKSTRSAPYII